MTGNKLICLTALHLAVVGTVLTPSCGYCVPRDYGMGSVVCVDDLSHCDLLGPVTPPAAGHLLQITTDKAGRRWNTSTVTWQDGFESLPSAAEVVLTLDRDKKFQRLEGFGGAFTDAASIAVQNLPPDLKECIVRSYFGPEGLDYALGRVPIGGTDFSLGPYSYDDLADGEADPELHKFALQAPDKQLKIPLLHAAQRARNSSLKLLASPWSAPGWMKDNGKINGKGALLSQYWDTYAQYIVRFFEEYKKQGLEFWAVTPQNEPSDGRLHNFPFNAMGWTQDTQAAWVGGFLGPQLRDAGFGSVKIFVLDDTRLWLPQWLDTLMANNKSSSFVSGLAVHWYLDWLTPASILDETHRRHPDVPILYTEGCTGSWPWTPLKVVLGSWKRAEDYTEDIIDTLNHWSVGWIDWNLAVNMQGGVNWVKNYVDAPIIVNHAAQEVYKQPMYYTMSHVTKFAAEGSVRIGLSSSHRLKLLTTVAFQRPDGSTAVILLNKRLSSVTVELRDPATGNKTLLLLEASSITSVLW